MVIDTHTHLSDPIYTDLNEIIENMPNDNLEKVVCASAGFQDSKRSVEIAKTNKNVTSNHFLKTAAISQCGLPTNWSNAAISCTV